MTKFDLKSEATRPIYAGVGATDLAVGFVREYAADLQKKLSEVQKDVQTRVTDLDFEPKALRDQAVAAIEARVAELQADAKSLPTRFQELLIGNAATVNETYVDLAKRGETLVERIRKQQSTQTTVAAAETTQAKAKTTKTQATKAAKTTAKSTTKKATSTAKKTTKAPKSSAKATATAAKTTASNAAQAVTDAAEKVGD
jgi:hypothetical protein